MSKIPQYKDPSKGGKPMNTPLKEMISQGQLEGLSTRAQQLTKQQLVDLANGTATPTSLNVSVEDLQSLRDVFGYDPIKERGPSPEVSIKCCCCCCAVASIKSL